MSLQSSKGLRVRAHGIEAEGRELQAVTIFGLRPWG